MRTETSVLFIVLFSACNGGVQVNNVVPATQQPTAQTAAPSPAAAPHALGSEASGPPMMSTSQPATLPPAPSSTTIVNNVSLNITNNLSFAWNSGDECAAYDLTEGLAYCDDAMPKYTTLCAGGKVYVFDCSSYGAAFKCGYIFENDGLVACVDAPDTKISDALSADKSFAFKTNIPCTAGDERYAECQGSYAYFCSAGDVYALDCSLYVQSASSAPASCGVSSSQTIDCHW